MLAQNQSPSLSRGEAADHPIRRLDHTPERKPDVHVQRDALWYRNPFCKNYYPSEEIPRNENQLAVSSKSNRARSHRRIEPGVFVVRTAFLVAMSDARGVDCNVPCFHLERNAVFLIV